MRIGTRHVGVEITKAKTTPAWRTRLPNPEDTATHKLTWQPPYVVEGGPSGGFWELYILYREMGEEPAVLHAPRDAPQDALGAWVAAQVGSPVSLVPGEEIIHPLTRWGLPSPRGRYEPVYYITAA